MCDCIPTIGNQLKGQLHNDKEIISGAIDTVYIKVQDSFENRTFSEATIIVSGYKSPRKTKFTHTYCPFCGEKYD